MKSTFQVNELRENNTLFATMNNLTKYQNCGNIIT